MDAKVIDFIITQKCTYECPYCSQSKPEQTEKKNASKDTILNFLRFLNRIDKDYEITITGGEAILHEDFYYLLKEIKAMGFKINLITNLSFPKEVYIGIFNILQDSLKHFDISCHLCQIASFDKFFEKLDSIINSKPKDTIINVLIPVYKINNEKAKNIKNLTSLLENYQIKPEFQHIRILNSYTNLTKIEADLLNEVEYIKPYSRYCNAGCLSCVIYEDGNVYRCYSSRFKKSYYLGSINNPEFKLNDIPKVCTNKLCTCPKASKYNQILEQKNLYKTICTNLFDILCLPKLLIINKDIVKRKIKQYLKLNN